MSKAHSRSRMQSEKDFIANSINQLDELIARATSIISQLRGSKGIELDDTKQIMTLESKIEAWIQKREVLLKLLIAPLTKNGKL